MIEDLGIHATTPAPGRRDHERHAVAEADGTLASVLSRFSRELVLEGHELQPTIETVGRTTGFRIVRMGRRERRHVIEEAVVFGGDDGAAQVRRDVVVMNHHAPLDGEFADQLTVFPQHPGDGVRRVVVEGADFGQVVRVREQHPADGAEQGGRDEEGGNAGVTGVSNGDSH